VRQSDILHKMEPAYSPDTPFAYIGIGSLLATPLRVPPNQRAYSWKAEQINDLLDDFESAMAESDAGEREYFLGSIVITASEDASRPAVVDGQQRLASVTMIYAAIRDYLVDHGEKDTADDVEKEYLYSRHKWTKEGTARLKLSDEDADFFERTVVARVNSEARQTKRVRKVPDSHKRIAKAFDLISDRIRSIAQGSHDPNKVLQEWEEFLQKSVKILVLMVRDESRAYQIFETLNDRGLELAIADLLKNFVLGKAGKRNFDQVRFQWNTAVSRLGGDAIVKRFIHHFWASKNGLVRERELYKRIRRSIRNERQALDFTVELAGSANNYAAILDADSPVWAPVGTRGKEFVSELKTLKMEQYKPLLLSCLDTFDPDKANELKKVLELLVVWSVRFQATQELGSSDIERFYPEAARAVREEKIKTATHLAERFTAQVPADGVFRSRFRTLTVENRQLARYYLRKLENRARAESGRKEHAMIADEHIVSLEHILPQGANLRMWPKFDDDEFKANLNRVGNLTLLLQHTNRDLSNLPFDMKRPVYRKQEALITKNAGEVDEWSPAAVEARQEWLAELAVREWPLMGKK
jgi:hypothetical protein